MMGVTDEGRTAGSCSGWQHTIVGGNQVCENLYCTILLAQRSPKALICIRLNKPKVLWHVPSDNAPTFYSRVDISLAQEAQRNLEHIRHDHQEIIVRGKVACNGITKTSNGRQMQFAWPLYPTRTKHIGKQKFPGDGSRHERGRAAAWGWRRYKKTTVYAS